jgi:hypothetical protein
VKRYRRRKFRSFPAFSRSRRAFFPVYEFISALSLFRLFSSLQMRHKFVGILNAKRARERERARANAKKKKRGRKRNDPFEKKSTKIDLATFAKPRLLLVFARSPKGVTSPEEVRRR